jgi:hypothetical protein
VANDHRSQTLRRHQAELAKLGDEAQKAMLAAEDALSAVEDREQRRSARTTQGQRNLETLRNR